MCTVAEKFPVLFTIHNGTFYWNEKLTYHQIMNTAHCLKIDENNLKPSIHAKRGPKNINTYCYYTTF
jgi:hypothetical protein